MRFRETSVVLTATQMRAADAATIATGISGFTLMTRAGRAVADTVVDVLDCLRGGGPADILVACGPGNNGGDGFVAAGLLAGKGHRVAVCLVGSRERLTGDAAMAANQWQGKIFSPGEISPERFALIVDALFGTGLTRDVAGEAGDLIARINAACKPVVAVDIPSGLDSDSGVVRGIVVRANRTVTFAARKLGHLLYPGRSFCGEVTIADIGIAPETLFSVAGATFINGPDLWGLPPLDPTAHKYQRGHTLVASGGALRTGAARLAARGALRVGSGLVTLASPPEALGVNAAHLTAIMLRGYDGPDGLATILADSRFNALVLGPALGVGSETRVMVEAALARQGLAIVLDADALTSFEGLSNELLGAFRNAKAVLTPHEGEFRRLFAEQADILHPASRLERARRAAAFTAAVVVLKGADTVIAAPDGHAVINGNGSPHLATAGSGDVLAGIVAGLMAQGMAAFDAACAAVWLHAEAGMRYGRGLIAEDIPEALPELLQDWERMHGENNHLA